MKKILTLLMAVIMTFVTMTSNIVGVAAESSGPTAKIHITNIVADTGIDLTGKSFEIYKVFGATVNNELETPSINYQLEEKFDGLFYTDLGLANEDAAENYIHDAYSTSSMQELVKKMETYVNKASNAVPVVGHISGSVSTIGNVQSMSSEALTPGYYLILDKSSNGSTMTAGMLVSIPVKNSSNDFADDAHISLKGSQPTIDKKIWHDDKNTTGDWDTVGDYQIGDEIDFLLTIKMPRNLAGYTDYKLWVTDSMSEGLTFKTGSLEIYLDKALTQKVEGHNHTEDYFENDKDGKVFQLTFNVLAIADKFPELEEFYVIYSATLNEKAEVANGKETNKVELVYNNNPYDPESMGKDESEVYAYTFALEAFKTDTTTVNPLANAVFQLLIKPLSESAEPYGVYLKQDETNPTIYYVQKEGTFDPGSNKGYIVTDASGKFTIKGLNDEVTYILRETKAPEGFTAAKDLSFKIHADYSSNTPGVSSSNPTKITVSTDGSLATTIINTSSSLFPGTGGMGTTLFVLAGCFMMLVAAIFYVIGMKKDMQKK